MSGTTPNEGMVYPLVTDYADVQDWYQLAQKADALIRQYDAEFKAAPRPLAFLGRSSANSSTFSTGFASVSTDVTEWDSTGGLSSSQFTQPLYDVPSWWLLGANAIFALSSGSYTLTDHTEAAIAVSTTDQVSGLSSTSYIRSKRTNCGQGESITVAGVALMWHGSAVAQGYQYGSGSSVIYITAGSRLWGVRLGPASV